MPSRAGRRPSTASAFCGKRASHSQGFDRAQKAIRLCKCGKQRTLPTFAQPPRLRNTSTPNQNRRLHKRLDTTAIRYLLGHQREEFLVIHGPEKVSEIRIDNPLRPALYLFPHFAQSVLRRSPSPISEAGIIE